MSPPQIEIHQSSANMEELNIRFRSRGRVIKKVVETANADIFNSKFCAQTCKGSEVSQNDRIMYLLFARERYVTTIIFDLVICIDFSSDIGW